MEKYEYHTFLYNVYVSQWFKLGFVLIFSPHLCPVSSWWTHFWHRYWRFHDKNLGFERKTECGQLPWPPRTNHQHRFLRKWYESSIIEGRIFLYFSLLLMKEFFFLIHVPLFRIFIDKLFLPLKLFFNLRLNL